ncbi:aminotransferase class V-fold PLP-dependent enzyme [Treponema phagedenis]|uniref:aminotransferase class I/II-fold pyridoxal phosphate-dependent enzyme n=1 Tax=Treponema phagedenis TaxID=162 RepID=UPI0011EE32D6|nr:aminotransferase class I/II-fold pyridoxal phosphate-dependent enzyme [Treponema phagedenis]QSH99048.1 aminotransferase class V-fold PLP-dependent enzyme [Treponema phagedenis]TYT79359.1 aminotransferase class I/II-fold pyridoxal phosphate-dependent enzyme [Treponema phagedenis]
MTKHTKSHTYITEILHHQGEQHFPCNAVSPPIFQTSIFCFDSYEAFQAALADEASHFLYSRGNNPTVNLCEEKLAALEHAEQAKLVTSGVSAAALAVLSQVKSGDHAIIVEDSYSWTKYLFETYLQRFNVSYTFVDGSKIEDFEKTVQPNTKLIYLESPATFTFKLQNLREVAVFARKNGIKTIIDNTWATPFFQNPIDYGIDIVIHSASKYIGGNSDIISGVIAGSKKDITHIFNTEFLPLGPVPDPMQAWLILRNLRTLHIRMPVHYANALALASFLEKHPAVETVLYPFLPSFNQYELAQSQMRGGSGLFSFRLKTRNLSAIKTLTNRLRYFKRAVSWGGYESLVFPAAVKYADTDKIPDDRISLIRLHAGIEEKEMLLEDLEQALNSL